MIEVNYEISEDEKKFILSNAFFENEFEKECFIFFWKIFRNSEQDNFNV
jgi:hypothetical protein